MNTKALVREATASDVTQLAPLLIELGYPVDVDVLAERFQSFTSLGECALVAELEGRLVGLLTLHVTNVLHRPGSVGRITTLVVATALHGKGIGRMLVEDAETRLWRKGCVLIEVTSNMKRTDAHAFYERLGYDKTSYRFGKTRPGS
jgi:ribosomal protein S18 acetylase RimI-like enzyme